VARVCSVSGTWQIEDPSDCSDTVVSDLFRRIDDLTPANSELVLTQVLQRQQLAVTAFGQSDVLATILFMSQTISLHPSMTSSMGTLLVELLSGLTWVRADILDRVHAHLTTDNHLLMIVERLFQSLQRGIGPVYEIRSVDGRVILNSKTYSTRRRSEGGSHAEFHVAPVNAPPQWIRVPLAPFTSVGISVPIIRFAYFANDNFLGRGRGQSGSTRLLQGGPVFAVFFGNWPAARTYPDRITYRLPPIASSELRWDCGSWDTSSAWSTPQCLSAAVGSELECSCFSGDGIYGLAPLSLNGTGTTVSPAAPSTGQTRTDPINGAVQALFILAISINTLSILGYIVLKRLRVHGRRFISMNVIAATAMAQICALLGFDQTADRCMVSGVFVLYFIMVSCIWLAVNAHTLYKTHVLQPILSTPFSDGAKLLVGWGFPAILAGIAAGASAESEWVQHGACWPSERLFWAAFGWPCIVAVAIMLALIVRTVRAPDVAIAQPDSSKVMHKSWERESGALSTAAHVFLHIWTWVLLAAAAYGTDKVSLFLAAIAALVQSLQVAGHQFLVRNDGRDGCVSLLTCRDPAPPSVGEGEDPEDFIAQVARIAGERVHTHLFECEQTSQTIAQLASSVVRSQIADSGRYENEVLVAEAPPNALEASLTRDGSRGSKPRSRRHTGESLGYDDQYLEVGGGQSILHRAPRASGAADAIGPVDDLLDMAWDSNHPGEAAAAKPATHAEPPNGASENKETYV